MANLQVKGVDDDFYEALKLLAKEKGRSLSQQVLIMLKEYLAKEKKLSKAKTPGALLLELAGSWEDERPAEAIIKELKASRKPSKKFEKGLNVSS